MGKGKRFLWRGIFVKKGHTDLVQGRIQRLCFPESFLFRPKIITQILFLSVKNPFIHGNTGASYMLGHGTDDLLYPLF